ncbi:hypothetical protein [Delftia sp. PE138]|uniref:hypothetical protein n=1 Tax=Delftia sp. PE138 TaxID=1812483 RepID=UPI001BAF14C3|nr:hypothetical protein [Delftia sp. PE138]MBS3723429.1 hypothetical protein [Delftia sp. PE138]
MQDKHTPGPWEWWTSNSFRRLSSKATGKDGDVLYATVQPSDGHPDVELPNGGWNGPDGCLIAAAPELLEALQAIFDDYKQLADSGDAGYWLLEETDVGKQAMAAIAKATRSAQ